MSYRKHKSRTRSLFLFLLVLMSISILISACDFNILESDLESDLESVLESDNEIVSEISQESNDKDHSHKEEYMPQNYEFIKAMWLSQYDMQLIYRDGKYQRNIISFKKLAEQILENIKKSGYNTVIIQLRPFADSFYPSEFFPPSIFVTGAYHLDHKYDPIEILIDIAHSKNLSVHAWINPLRAMTDLQLQDVDKKYLIKKWYDNPNQSGKNIVKAGTGNTERWYLNPCYPEVRNLIADGAAEIVQKYNIDGIHMDDYFYPTKETYFDSSAFSSYKNNGGNLSLDDFRRQNISLMVKEIYDSIKNISKDVLFGISPAGIFNTTYNDLYADVVLWCKEEGYIDYIVPQIYFGLEHQNFDFITVYKLWQNLEKHQNLKFCFGVSLGKAKSGVDVYAGTGKEEWKNHNDILKRCLEFVNDQADSDGIFMFCYQYYFDPLTGISVAETKDEIENFAPVFNITSSAS